MAEVESVSPVPSTSNLLNPLIPTTITAEIRVEPQQQQQSSSTSSPAATSTTNASTALIVAPTLNNNNSSNQEQENTADTDEPEPKRKKLDTPKLSSKLVEKLEARLGGILCCAVCLDLPRTAMYQVINFFLFIFVLYFSSFTKHFLYNMSDFFYPRPCVMHMYVPLCKLCVVSCVLFNKVKKK